MHHCRERDNGGGGGEGDEVVGTRREGFHCCQASSSYLMFGPYFKSKSIVPCFLSRDTQHMASKVPRRQGRPWCLDERCLGKAFSIFPSLPWDPTRQAFLPSLRFQGNEEKDETLTRAGDSDSCLLYLYHYHTERVSQLHTSVFVITPTGYSRKAQWHHSSGSVRSTACSKWSRSLLHAPLMRLVAAGDSQSSAHPPVSLVGGV